MCFMEYLRDTLSPLHPHELLSILIRDSAHDIHISEGAVMDTTILQSNIEALRTFVDEHGWRILDEKSIQSGYQLIVSDGTIKIPVDFFYTGKALVLGKT